MVVTTTREASSPKRVVLYRGGTKGLPEGARQSLWGECEAGLPDFYAHGGVGLPAAEYQDLPVADNLAYGSAVASSSVVRACAILSDVEELLPVRGFDIECFGAGRYSECDFAVHALKGLGINNRRQLCTDADRLNLGA